MLLILTCHLGVFAGESGSAEECVLLLTRNELWGRKEAMQKDFTDELF